MGGDQKKVVGHQVHASDPRKTEFFGLESLGTVRKVPRYFCQPLDCGDLTKEVTSIDQEMTSIDQEVTSID